jgi:vacuolar-type H+-ATPase subunit I/STV1
MQNENIMNQTANDTTQHEFPDTQLPSNDQPKETPNFPQNRPKRGSAYEALQKIKHIHVWENAKNNSQIVREAIERIEMEFENEKKRRKISTHIGPCIATFSDTDSEEFSNEDPDTEQCVNEDKDLENNLENNSDNSDVISIIHSDEDSSNQNTSDEDESDLSFVVSDDSDNIEYENSGTDSSEEEFQESESCSDCDENGDDVSSNTSVDTPPVTDA